jgi:hypothetical protein
MMTVSSVEVRMRLKKMDSDDKIKGPKIKIGMMNSKKDVMLAYMRTPDNTIVSYWLSPSKEWIVKKNYHDVIRTNQFYPAYEKYIELSGQDIDPIRIIDRVPAWCRHYLPIDRFDLHRVMKVAKVFPARSATLLSPASPEYTVRRDHKGRLICDCKTGLEVEHGGKRSCPHIRFVEGKTTPSDRIILGLAEENKPAEKRDIPCVHLPLVTAKRKGKVFAKCLRCKRKLLSANGSNWVVRK